MMFVPGAKKSTEVEPTLLNSERCPAAFVLPTEIIVGNS